MGVHGDVAAPPRLHCEQRLMLSRWSQIFLGARGFAFSRFRRASAAWRRLGAFALSRETALARENADFSGTRYFVDSYQVLIYYRIRQLNF
jgi:hypothetical protein